MNTAKYKQAAPETFYHLYNRGNKKQNIFFNIADYQFYLYRLRFAMKRFGFKLICYCLMPNHVHLVVQQTKDFSPAKFISSLHTSYAMVINKKYQLVGHLFQGRYKQKIIQTDEYMKSLIAYIHLNPVKANLCSLPKNYQWSSYREYAMPNNVTNNLCDKTLVENYGLKGLSFEQFISQAGNINSQEAFDEED